MTEESERKIIFSLMKELNDTYAINVPEQPVLSRSSGSDNADPAIGTGRIFAIGGSHIKRLVGGLAGLSMEIIDLSKPGWKADPDPLAELAAKTKKYGLCDTDTVVIDVLSNSVICGTGTRGKPAEQFKSDGKWHVPGSLCFEPKSVLKAVLAEAKEKIFTGISPKLVCVGPLPRYVLEKCCTDPGHIQNIDASDYVSDMEQNIEIIDDLLVGWAQEINGRSDYLNFRMVADNPDLPLQDLTVSGEQLWAAGDPVHGSNSYYTELAAAVTEMVRSALLDEGASMPAAKRPRLESVIVKRRGDLHDSKKVSHTASWSTGSLPPLRGGSGANSRGPFRGRSGRGGFRGRWRPFLGRGKHGP
jgi:hypothetical protein